MAEYSYTTVPGKIKTFLEKLRQAGIPEKATVKWLKTIGFTSSNDRSLLSVLRQIGFIDKSGVPTQTWRAYRGADYRRVLASAIREGYADLFRTYPDAHVRESADIENVVRQSTDAGDRAVTLAVRTFRELCLQAEFTATIDRNEAREVGSQDNSQQESQAKEDFRWPGLHIDIQVHISPEASSEQIDKIFESMARHLYQKGARTT